MVTYDLHKPERDYNGVIAKIKSFGSAVEVEESVWLVDTTKTCSDCRDALKTVTKEATYFVAGLSGNWATFNAGKSVTDWLNAGARNW